MDKVSNIKYFQILGERCSGTNYIEELMEINFNITKYEVYHKHFFLNIDCSLNNVDEILFICIIRNIKDWVNSLYRHGGYHLHPHNKTSINNFLYGNTSAYWYDDNQILRFDRPIKEEPMIDNIIKMRYIKYNYLLDVFMRKYPNVHFIKYEDLVDDYGFVLGIMKETYNLKMKKNIFTNTTNYKKQRHIKFKPSTEYIIDEELIFNHPDYVPLDEIRYGYWYSIDMLK